MVLLERSGVFSCRLEDSIPAVNNEVVVYDAVYAYNLSKYPMYWYFEMKAKASKNGNLIRKQFLVSSSQVEKLSALSASEGKSEAEIVRLAIDAFEPKCADNMNAPELMELVSQRLKEAISSTKQANKVVSKTLENLALEN